MGITDRNKPLTAEEVPAARKVAESRRYMLRGAVKCLFHGRTVNRRYTAARQILLDAMAGRCGEILLGDGSKCQGLHQDAGARRN